MEANLKICSKLSEKQCGFKRGCSTVAIGSNAQTRQETHPQQRNGSFRDIKGAFDNVAFDSIKRSLSQNCESNEVNLWTHNRKTSVELQGQNRVIRIRKGCPQCGILLSGDGRQFLLLLHRVGIWVLQCDLPC